MAMANDPTKRVLNIFSIIVPAHMRRKGIATRVLTAVEIRAKREGCYAIVVGPLIGEDSTLERILHRRGYGHIPPFSAIKLICDI
jgi:GNAT superfamily N-acetyltransferase